jgi:hypothetical protein
MCNVRGPLPVWVSSREFDRSSCQKVAPAFFFVKFWCKSVLLIWALPQRSGHHETPAIGDQKLYIGEKGLGLNGAFWSPKVGNTTFSGRGHLRPPSSLDEGVESVLDPLKSPLERRVRPVLDRVVSPSLQSISSASRPNTLGQAVGGSARFVLAG